VWVDKKRSWIQIVLFGGRALPRIWFRTLFVTALSALATVLYAKVPAFHYSLTPTTFTLLGLPLGIFLGFRNGASYDRFWEGRKLWGALVNTSRSFARQILTLVAEEADEPGASSEPVRKLQIELVHTMIAYVHALRLHLRDGDAKEALGEAIPAPELDAIADDDNVPLAVLQRIGVRLADARRRQWIHPFHLPVLEQSLAALTDIQGACERIKSTPVPWSYTVLMHRIVGVYCALLPFGFMDSVGWLTPVVVLVISYCFFGLDSIGEEIEQPFGLERNDLPLLSISTIIERDLRRRLGEAGPPKIKAKRGVLS
jgi:putative membrane protein